MPQEGVDTSTDRLEHRELSGLVSIEAEHYAARAAGTGAASAANWTLTTALAGYSGSAALTATPNAGVNTGDTAIGPRLDYRVTFARTGTYYVWVRMRGASGADDSVHVGLNGTLASLGATGMSDSSKTWHWEQYAGSRRVTVTVPSAGVHTLSLYMREDGTSVDKLVLTTDAAYVPSGTGPAETPAHSTGALTREVWTNVTGTTVASIPLSTPPNSVGSVTSFEAPTNVGDQYGQRLRGYIVPPATGAYTFFIAADDAAELWLSTDESPTNARRIAYLTSWTEPRAWTWHTSQRSAAVNLVAGQRYYVHALMKEVAGGDNLAVGWLKPGQSGVVPSEIVPGSALAPFGIVGQDPSPPPPPNCFNARRLWFEDFETLNYSRWTSNDKYGNTTRGCATSGFSSERRVSGSYSHRTSVGCASTGDHHRVNGGLQFSGDTRLPAYTNSGVGLDAPYGVVNTFHSYLDVPYSFGNGRWFSLWTATNSCDYTDRVVTLGLEDPSNRLTPAHILDTGGTVSFAPNAPVMPLRQWVRTTVYINYYDGVIHVWQNGRSVVHGTFRRSTRQICHFHWGLYASRDNTDIVLFEDDMSLWKLGERWTNFDVEPYFGATQPVCSN